MWQHLIETALIGTEKTSLKIEMLPEEIRNSVSVQADTEQYFLQSAALAYFYLEAGKLPELIKLEIEEREIEEKLNLASEDLNSIYPHLEKVNGKLKEYVFVLWLDVLLKKQCIISPDYVIQLLSHGNSFSNETKSKILQVVGEKGRWIVQMDENLHYETSKSQQEIWTDGNIHERKSIFTKQLKLDSDQAIAMLESTWDQEPIVNKRAFLEILKEVRGLAVLEFAHQKYEQEFAFNTKEKKTEKECRRILAELLLSSEGSSLQQSTIQTLKIHFTKEKKKGLLGFVSSKSEFDFAIPMGEDEQFWNAANMDQLYGLESKNYDIASFHSIQQYWLSFFLATIPASIWIDGLLNSANDFLHCFLDKDNFKIKVNGNMRPIFFDAIIQNAERFANEPLVLSLLSRTATNESIQLLKQISKEEFEQFVRKHKYFSDERILSNGPYQIGETWPSDFSAVVLSHIYEQSMQQFNGNLHALSNLLGQYLHLDSFYHLQKYHESANGSNFYYQWKSSFYEPLNTVLNIRKLIQSANNS